MPERSRSIVRSVLAVPPIAMALSPLFGSGTAEAAPVMDSVASTNAETMQDAATAQSGPAASATELLVDLSVVMGATALVIGTVELGSLAGSAARSAASAGRIATAAERQAAAAEVQALAVKDAAADEFSARAWGKLTEINYKIEVRPRTPTDPPAIRLVVRNDSGGPVTVSAPEVMVKRVEVAAPDEDSKFAETRYNRISTSGVDNPNEIPEVQANSDREQHVSPWVVLKEWELPHAERASSERGWHDTDMKIISGEVKPLSILINSPLFDAHLKLGGDDRYTATFNGRDIGTFQPLGVSAATELA